MRPINQKKAKQKTDLEKEIIHQLWKKRKALKDLQLRNLLKTNLELLRNLDISNAVLF